MTETSEFTPTNDVSSFDFLEKDEGMFITGKLQPVVIAGTASVKNHGSPKHFANQAVVKHTRLFHKEFLDFADILAIYGREGIGITGLYIHTKECGAFKYKKIGS